MKAVPTKAIKGTFIFHCIMQLSERTMKLPKFAWSMMGLQKLRRKKFHWMTVWKSAQISFFTFLTCWRNSAATLLARKLTEKPFLNVGIEQEHRDMLRFLWFKDTFEEQLETVRFRFNCLVFRLHPSPSILGATIKHYFKLFKQDQPEMAWLLKESF